MSGFEQTVGTLKAAGEPTRLRLLRLLQEGEYSVKDLTELLGQSQPRVSRHIKLLGEAGLVERRAEGSFVFVRAASHLAIRSLVESALALVPEGDLLLRRDRERASQLRARQALEAQAYFDRNADRWDEIRSLHVPEKDVEGAIIRLLGTGPFDLLLDLGTGTGRILELLAGTARQAVGIDTNREMLKCARARLDTQPFAHCSVRLGDLYDLPFAEKSADAVVLHQVLHFLESPKAAVLEAMRVLRPGGRLLIADFAPHDLEFLRTDHAHLRLGFGADEVMSWLAAPGMSPPQGLELRSPGTGSAGLTVVLWLAVKTESASAQGAKVKEVSE